MLRLMRDMRRGLMAGALMLAGCAEEASTGATSQPANPAAQAGAASAAAAAAASDSQLIRMAQCSTPAAGTVSFRIGQGTLRIPANVVQDAIPTGMQAPLKKEAVRAEVQARVASGAGCPEKPLDTTLLLVRDDLGHPLLEGSLAMLRAAPGDITRQFAELTERLRTQPSQNCRDLSEDLLACVGTENRAGRETPVMYVISKDRSVRMNTGGPLAARCVLENQAIQGCNIVDQIDGNITIDITLNAGDYTSSSLDQARRAALARLASWRV